MEQTQTQNHTGDAGVSIVVTTIVLIVETLDPLLINPDYLKRKGIVDESLQTKSADVTTDRSVLTFSGGSLAGGALVFVAERQKLQITGPYGFVDVQGIVRRYVEDAEGLYVKAMGTNWVGNPASKAESFAFDPLKGFRERLQKDGDVPTVELTATYAKDQRRAVHFTVAGSGSSAVVHVNFHRDFTGFPPEKRREETLAALASGGQDLAEFRDLVEKCGEPEQRT